MKLLLSAENRPNVTYSSILYNNFRLIFSREQKQIMSTLFLIQILTDIMYNKFIPPRNTGVSLKQTEIYQHVSG